jgi:hypothetical protein
MQINLYSKKYKNYFLYLGWVLLILFLFFKGCNPEPQIAEKIKIQTKEIKGEAIIKTNIVHVPITKKVRDTAGIGFYVSQIDKLFSENNKMQNEFLKMDSLQQIEAYNKAIQINTFKQSFDDKYINAQVSGEVSGNIHAMKFDYIIKAQTMEVNAPKRKLSVLGGFFIANDIQLQKPLFGAELDILNKKGNLLRIAFDTDKRFYFGYIKKLF